MTSKKKTVRRVEFNGYDFFDVNMQKRMKYLVVKDGDLDLNGAYAFETKKALRNYLKNPYAKVIAIFAVKRYDSSYKLKQVKK